MFGYITPLPGEMKVKEFKQFQAAYCGLCHTMGKSCGQCTRLSLNYDFAFLAMLLEGEDQAGPDQQRRCVASPLRRRSACEATDAFQAAASTSVILTHWKLRDNVADEGFWKKLVARFLLLILRRSYKKARKRQPKFDETAGECLGQLRSLEESRCPSIDRPADAFARLLMAAGSTVEESRRRPVEQVLYHVGRWIYLADAYDDLEEDTKQGRYNPLALRFEIEDGPLPSEAREELETTMRHSLNLAGAAYRLGEFGRWSPVLENILYISLPLATERILQGAPVKWDKFAPELERLHQ